ncbi:MAG: N-acetyltransferase family protein [Candidatus Azobacteroides sp.]|nr:N-acetyltransferase family protein [Candidatus Azobacteroides sp.]
MQVRTIESKDYSFIADIYNYYIEHSNAAFPEENIDVTFIASLHKSVLTDSFLVLDNGEKVIGFGLLKDFLPFENFSRTASITYFISPEYTRCSLGSLLLKELTNYAEEYKIDNFIAVIASDNTRSINFHKKQGFQLCGTLKNIGYKKNKDFSIIYMQKYIK